MTKSVTGNGRYIRFPRYSTLLESSGKFCQVMEAILREMFYLLKIGAKSFGDHWKSGHLSGYRKYYNLLPLTGF